MEEARTRHNWHAAQLPKIAHARNNSTTTSLIAVAHNIYQTGKYSVQNTQLLCTGKDSHNRTGASTVTIWYKGDDDMIHEEIKSNATWVGWECMGMMGDAIKFCMPSVGTSNDLIGFGCGRAAENLLHWLADCASYNGTSNSSMSSTPLSIFYSIHGNTTSTVATRGTIIAVTITCVYTRASSAT